MNFPAGYTATEEGRTIFLETLKKSEQGEYSLAVGGIRSVEMMEGLLEAEQKVSIGSAAIRSRS